MNSYSSIWFIIEWRIIIEGCSENVNMLKYGFQLHTAPLAFENQGLQITNKKSYLVKKKRTMTTH